MSSQPKRDIARELFKSFKTQTRRNKKIVENEDRVHLSDPQPLSSVFNEVIANRDWKQGIAEGNLFS